MYSGTVRKLDLLKHRMDSGSMPWDCILGPPVDTIELCDACDGTGWTEGGECLKTTCYRCNGRGKCRIVTKSARCPVCLGYLSDCPTCHGSGLIKFRGQEPIPDGKADS